MSNLSGINEVTTTVTLTLAALMEAFKREIPELKMVYDEKFSYESAVENFRANNNLNKENTNMYPLFAFKRSVLRHSETHGPGRRATGIMARRDMSTLEKPKTSNVYRLVHGEFDVNFLYITKEIAKLELFEILYLAEEGISSYKEISVDLTTELGAIFPYYVDYAPLEDKVFEIDNVSYKAIQGSVKVRGFYPVLRAEAKHILEINTRILSFLGAVYGTGQIKANTF